MPNKPTITAAIIEANRAKNPDRPTTDYDHRAACMDVLIEAARYRQKMHPKRNGWTFVCPNCKNTVRQPLITHMSAKHYCNNCGQALDWSD
jgi:predicted RNA-binding Zn-ribbon protein involved in translation (DUF1610 family)